MQTTIILAIIAIVAGAVTSLIPIQQVSALLGQGPPSNFPHSPLGALKGDLGAVRGDLGSLNGLQVIGKTGLPARMHERSTFPP
jgi:hypothetical protein